MALGLFLSIVEGGFLCLLLTNSATALFMKEGRMCNL